MKISMFKDAKGPVAGVIFAVLLVLSLIAGWITNVIWTFKQDTLTDILLGILGCLIAPVGALHGIYTWF